MSQVREVPVHFQPRLIELEDQVITKALAILERRLSARRSEEACSTFSGAQISKDFLKLKLAAEKEEIFAMIMLDNQHRLIKYVEVHRGTVDAASVYPRTIARFCLEAGAAAVIISHNHPSGITEPSNADRQITKRIKESLGLIDVRVLDHIIVGEGEPLSFAERGIL